MTRRHWLARADSLAASDPFGGPADETTSPPRLSLFPCHHQFDLGMGVTAMVRYDVA